MIGFGRQVKSGLLRLLGRREQHDEDEGEKRKPKRRPAGLASRFR